jgi:hypothetical protein
MSSRTCSEFNANHARTKITRSEKVVKRKEKAKVKALRKCGADQTNMDASAIYRCGENNS